MRRFWNMGMLVAVATLAGCSTTGPFGREKLALPIGPSYVGGRGMQIFPTSPALVTNVKDSLSNIGVHSIVQNEDPSGLIVLEGRTVDDRKSRVTILTSGKNSTVSAKIGWLGDEPLTRSLLEGIGSRQGTLPPPPSIPDDAPVKEPGRTQPLFSREAVDDSTMLRDQLNSGYVTSPQP